MAINKRMPIYRFFIISGILGLLTAFGFDPVKDFAAAFAKNTLKLGAAAEPAAVALTGIFIIGPLFFYFIQIALNIFTKSMLDSLIKEMKEKQLLPGKYTAYRRRNLMKLYENIMSIFSIFISMFTDIKQDREKFSQAVEKFLDPKLKKEIHARSAEEIYIGGKKKKATVFFSDIRGFTSMTEKFKPELIVEFLNDYFNVATSIIEKNHGSVNKYIGDAVLAVFDEAPKYMDYLDADKAIIAAIDIRSHFEPMAKKWREKLGPEFQVGLGIGLARGEMIAGNMGSEKRMEYTVIGDTVNMASRLCSKACDGQIIITEEIYRTVEHLIVADELPPVQLKGKSGFYNIYSVKARNMLV